MFEILGGHTVLDVRGFLFTYNGTKEVFITAFDSHCNEIIFPGTPLCMGNLIDYILLNIFLAYIDFD